MVNGPALTEFHQPLSANPDGPRALPDLSARQAPDEWTSSGNFSFNDQPPTRAGCGQAQPDRPSRPAPRETAAVGHCLHRRPSSTNSADPALLFEIEFQILEHPHCRGAAGAEHTTARVLERANEIEALYSRNGELPEIRRRTMRA